MTRYMQDAPFRQEKFATSAFFFALPFRPVGMLPKKIPERRPRMHICETPERHEADICLYIIHRKRYKSRAFFDAF